ncbi:MAG: NCS2 family permease, partial [Oscillospiraceae bacterium]
PITLSDPATIMGDTALATQMFNGVFIATCLSSAFGSLLMGLYANVPFALAPGMGLNAFFAYTIMLGMGYSYGQTLAITFISGILFIVITIVGFREAIVESIPKNIKLAIASGIGLFLGLLGFKNAGIVVANPNTLVSLPDFSKFTDPEFAPAIFGSIVALIGLIVICVLYSKNVKGAIIIGILVSTVIGIPLGITQIPDSFSINFAQQFSDFTDVSLFAFGDGLIDLFKGKNLIDSVIQIAILVISFSIVDMFDSIGSLLGTAKKANLLDADGNMRGMKKALMCDAVATSVGAMLGTSTVTVFVESSAGIGEGGRTGLSSVFTSAFFILALIFAPIVGIIPAAATAPALIFVGVLMVMSSIKEIDFENIKEAVPAFFTIALMPLTFSIANGIAFGIITYTLIRVLSFDFKGLRLGTIGLTILFLVKYFIITAG